MSSLPSPPHLIKPVPLKPAHHQPPLEPSDLPRLLIGRHPNSLDRSAAHGSNPLEPTATSSSLQPPAQPRRRPASTTGHHAPEPSPAGRPTPTDPPAEAPLLTSASSASSSRSSSSVSNSPRRHPNQPRDRPRIDSFFGLDHLDRFIQSPQSTLPQPPFPSHPSSHPQSSPGLHPDDLHHHPPPPADPYLRPSSFYGLHLEPSQERPSDALASNHHHRRSSGTNSPASSLPSDPIDLRHRSLNPHLLARSTQRRHSSRLSSIPHPQDALLLDPNQPNLLSAGPLLDHSHLKPGHKAKLLNHAKTLELYRANAKKTNDPEVMFEFGCFLMDLVKEMDGEEEEEEDSFFLEGARTDSPEAQKRKSSHETPKASNQGEKEKEKVALTQEALFLLQKLANRGHVQSQFLLADCYTKGIGTGSGLSPGGFQQLGNSPSSDPPSPMTRKSFKQDYERAFPLFVLAAKHGHVEAMYRAGQCCEYGWGTRKERDKALQFYRKAAIAQHPLAMYRLSLADLNGDLGYPRRPKDGVKWLKRAAELADASHPNSLHELALLHERGLEHVVFVDYDYAVELLARAAELGYAPSAYKLGECYEYGRMGCPQDAALSIHYYNIAAQQNHKEACFALTAWYLVGSPGVLPQSDTEAYLWAKKAAEAGLAKAEYAVGYFTEVGVGTARDDREALRWFKRAAEHGDKRAKERLRNGIAGVTIDISPDEDENQKNKNISKRKTRASFGGARLNGGGPNVSPTNVNHPLPPSTITPTGPQFPATGGEESKKGKEECIIV